MEDLTAKLRELIDRQEIEQVLKLYCRAIDRLDAELLKSVYHPDATDDHGSYSGNAHGFADFIIPSMAQSIADGMHTVTHCTIDLDGDFATAESYYWAYQRTAGGYDHIRAFFGASYADARVSDGTIDGFHEFYCGGRYIDLFERRAGVWRILRRKITNEWNDIRPSSRISEEGFVAVFNLPGRRDRKDPVYLNRLPSSAGDAAVSATGSISRAV